MQITSLSFKLNGTEISLADESIRLHEVVIYQKNQPARLSFVKECVVPQPDGYANATAELFINGDLVFFGRVRTREFHNSEQTGYSYLYTAEGMEYVGDDIPVVSPFDGTGTASFNLDPTSLDYDPIYAGKSLGQMIRLILEQNDTAAALSLHNIGKYTVTTSGGTTTYTLDSRTLSDLTTDSYLAAAIPPKPITFSGDTLFQAIRGVMQSFAPNHIMWIQYVREGSPAANYGIIRFTDQRTTSANMTISIGTDPAPQLKRDYSQSYGRVTVRGGPNVQPVILSTKANELLQNFTQLPWYANNTAAIAAWKLSTWTTQDANLTVEGTCLCRRPRTANEANSSDPAYIADPANAVLADPNWLYVDPNNNNLTWIADDWTQGSTKYAGFVYITRKDNTPNQQFVARTVVSNTNLTAGGKSYLGLNSPLPNTDFNNFTMTAKLWPGVQTWRRYKINANTADGKPIGKYVQSTFPVAMPWINNDGSVLSYTNSGVGQISWINSGDAGNTVQSSMLGFQVDRQAETITFDRPVVTLFNSASSLSTGGANLTAPTNIRVLLPVSIGPLEATIPADTVTGNVTVKNYEGTANSVDSVPRTLIVNNREWTNETDLPVMQSWARHILDSVKDTVIDGTAMKYDYTPVFGPGMAIAFNDPCHANNPYANMTSQVSGCLLKFNHGGAVPYHTELAVSNRRAHFNGFEGYLHPHILMPMAPGQYKSDFAGSLASNPVEESRAMNLATGSRDMASLSAEAQATMSESQKAAKMADLAQLDYLI